MVAKHVLFYRGWIVVGVAIALGLNACQAPKQPSQATAPTPAATGPIVKLYGAGATFPSFLYLRWFDEYKRQHPNVRISYQPIGSAAGIQQFVAGTVDFGASEITLTPAEVAQVKRGVVFLPTAAGTIAVVYNLPGVKTGLKLSRQVLPAIFLGQITRWNDPKITALNPGVTLPDLPITVVHRSDGSGTTAAFTAYLSAISPAWQEKVGTGLNVQWPAGVGIKDNAGIAAQIQQGAGTLGYVEYAFAKQLQLPTAALENKAGQYVEPTLEAGAKALAAIRLSEDLQGRVADPDGTDAYPIVTYSWLLAYKQYDDPAKAKALREVVQWGVTEGQKFGPDLGYVPLPAEIVQKVATAVNQVAQ